jgi:hypothetical protein
MAKLGYHVGRGKDVPNGSFTFPDDVSDYVQFKWTFNTHQKVAWHQQLLRHELGLQELQ